MDLVTLCPFVTSKIVWQAHSGAFALTVIVKATFLLRPGTAELAPSQDPICERDLFIDDDPRKSLRVPTDVVPYKPRADILLVGHAYAPDKLPVRSLVTRFVVGEMDKSIEVFCDRLFRVRDGQLLEGKRFTKMPLSWELTSGGQDSLNPAGKSFDGPVDPYGSIVIGNLQPLGHFVSKRSDTFAPTCYAPIAPTWPGRTQRLGRLSRNILNGAWNAQMLPVDLDPMFFQAAPPDQTIGEIRPNERICLENLHPVHARLVTNLPGLKPRAIVDRATGEREEIALSGDTLWIDTDRSICCVVWRGRIGLRSMDEVGTVSISIDGNHGSTAETEDGGKRLAAAQLPQVTIDDDAVVQTVVGTFARKSSAAVMPFASTCNAPIPKQSAPISDDVLPFGKLALGFATTGNASAPSPVAPIAPLKPPALVAPQIPGAGSAPNPPTRLDGGGLPLGSLHAQSALLKAAQAEASPSSNSARPLFFSPESSPLAGSSAPKAIAHDINAVKAGLAGASDAAATAEKPLPTSTTPVNFDGNQRESGHKKRSSHSDYLDLLWFDEQLPQRLRTYTPWTTELRNSKPTTEWVTGDIANAPQSDRDDICRALGRITPLDASSIGRVISDGIDEAGVLARPLVVVNGELTVLFAPWELLEAVISAAAHCGTTDKRLEEAIQSANPLVSGGARSPVVLIDAAIGRIRQAFGQSNRALPPDYIDLTAQRLLTQERRYRTRKVFGGPHLSFTLTLSPKATIPTYLPEVLAQKLPLYPQLRVRIVAEVHAQQDPTDIEPVAFLVLAIGRILPTSPSRHDAVSAPKLVH